MPIPLSAVVGEIGITILGGMVWKGVKVGGRWIKRVFTSEVAKDIATDVVSGMISYYGYSKLIALSNEISEEVDNEFLRDAIHDAVMSAGAVAMGRINRFVYSDLGKIAKKFDYYRQQVKNKYSSMTGVKGWYKRHFDMPKELKRLDSAERLYVDQHLKVMMASGMRATGIGSLASAKQLSNQVAMMNNEAVAGLSNEVLTTMHHEAFLILVKALLGGVKQTEFNKIKQNLNLPVNVEDEDVSPFHGRTMDGDILPLAQIMADIMNAMGYIRKQTNP